MAQHVALRLQKPSFKSVVKQVIRNKIVYRNESFFRIMIREELRRVIREEFQRVVQQEFPHLIQPLLQQLQRSPPLIPTTCTSEARYKLRFINEVSSQIYVGNPIKAKDGSTIMLELIDCDVGDQRITSGQLASVQVEILALRSDFVQTEWDNHEFSHSILHQRSGRAPLLTGNVFVTLREGLGVIDNVVFTDVSSRTDQGKFRLGARASHALNVKEAKTHDFIVKCGRLKDHKHRPPKPNSEVWRLDQIGKNGTFQNGLNKHHIHTVKDFLRMYITNPTELRKIINHSGKMTENAWNIMVTHALECKLDMEELYVYNGGPNGFNLLLNAIYNVVGILIDGLNILCLNQLEPSQQALVHQLKLQAYKNIDKFVPFDPSSISLGPSRPLPNSDGLISVDQTTVVTSYQSLANYSHQLEISTQHIGSNEPMSFPPTMSEQFDFSIPCSSIQSVDVIEQFFSPEGAIGNPKFF